jgi:rhomboid family GlyGly-CTERM serine protease
MRQVMRQTYQVIRQSPVTTVVAVLATLIGFSDSLTTLLDIHLHGQITVLQLVTCHLTHWSAEHSMWDIGMFAVLGVMCERAAPRAFYATLLSSALLIPLCVMLSNPTIDIYRGLSGIDTGIFALFASISLFKSFSKNDGWSMAIFGIMLVLLWCKIAFEFWSGNILFVQQLNFVPVPMAHAVGAVLGSIIGLVVALQSQLSIGITKAFGRTTKMV